MSLPSTPSTPLSDEIQPQSSPVLSTPSGRRKQVVVEAYQHASSTVRALLERDDVPPAYRDAFQNLITAVDHLAGFKKLKAEPPTLPASSIQHINDAAGLFGLEFSDTDPEYVWDIPNNGPPISLSPETDNLLRRMRHANFWIRNSAESLSRTFIDLLCLIGGHPLSAQSPSDQRVSGIADYVLGYEPPVRTARSFESFSIIVEAKKDPIGPGLGQIVAYMVAAQQHRLGLRPWRITNHLRHDLRWHIVAFPTAGWKSPSRL
ncbi:hypothetical protein AJ79_06287 [Helicocarpus griseus UAMH5409]|uniref:Uncharacterized protein n=1 Tax=Helicocarpus griseus UAMH5409 TaxID=1447875 RepID=A0A2B7XEM4_9EURO|nr:hypothetical protein AJ79_06287 [Helicocarpus griseus UAMH5409]